MIPSVKKMVPFGILETKTDHLTVVYGETCETSDFIVDALEAWWDSRESQWKSIRKLVINLDNGPNNSSHRTQFMKRMVEFSDKNKLEIELAYYPPYHSKYNPIERCWGILETHWNGSLLSTTDDVIEWTKSMTWKGMSPTVKLITGTYEKGVKVATDAFKVVNERLLRDCNLPKYHVRIQPQLSDV